MNKNIETLLPKDKEIAKEKNKKRVIIIVSVGTLIIVLMSAIFIFLKDKNKNNNSPSQNNEEQEEYKNEKNPNEEIEESITLNPEKKNTKMICTKDKIKGSNYTIEYTYEYRFEGYTPVYGQLRQVYEFDSIEDYNSVKFPDSPNFNPVDIKEDSANLKKTLYFINIYSVSSSGVDALKEYQDKIEKQGYKCIEDNSNKEIK